MSSAVDFEKDLLALLRSSESLSAIVGDKIFLLYIPQGTPLPCVSFQRLLGVPANTLMGASGLEKISLQIDVWGRNYSECKEAAKAIRAIMPVNGPWGAHLQEDQDTWENDTECYRIRMEYVVWFCENADA